MSTVTHDPMKLSYDAAVERRYAQAAVAREPALCCPPAQYDPELLRHLPAEIIERDYGCGDPTRHVEPGERVVDLGSGSGKACYMLSSRVGTTGRVVGVDCNDAMLALARSYQPQIAQAKGIDNVRFIKARIQDLALDLDAVAAWLDQRPVRTLDDWAALERECERLRTEAPAVADGSADVVISDCVLNLVNPADKQRLFTEIHRVLRPGGRAVISDIVCDEGPTPAILDDPELWSGCISGAFREDRFLAAFEEAGFYGIEILSRAEAPWQVIDGVEFRSVTLRAFKGKEGPCLERNQAVIYKGPFSSVRDDDGHTLLRGRPMAVCDKTFRIMTDPGGPYAGHIAAVPPRIETPADEAEPFNCRGGAAAVRDPRQTKGAGYRETVEAEGPCCGPDGGC